MKKFLLSLLLLVISFFAISVETYANNSKNIKFAQVSDVHLSANSEYSKNVLKSTIADINSQQDISFVVFTGDNINNPKEEDLKAFFKIVKTLKVPYYIVLGDNDVYKANGLSKERYYEILKHSNWLLFRHKPNYKFTKKGFVFLTVDGAKEVIPGTVGYYRQATLDWVDKELSRNSKKDVIIFQHFPIDYPEKAESSIKTHKTYKVENYIEMINKHDNLLAIISGHFHTNYENMTNGVYHISTPSLLALPHSYKLIDIITTKDFSPLIYTQLREVEVKDSAI